WTRQCRRMVPTTAVRGRGGRVAPTGRGPPRPGRGQRRRLRSQSHRRYQSRPYLSSPRQNTRNPTMENTTAQSTPSNHMKASGVYAGSFSRQERTRYRYTAPGWYSMIHPQLNCPRYLSMEKITPEAYISTRMKWGSRLSRSGASATQRATRKAQPVEKSHI